MGNNMLTRSFFLSDTICLFFTLTCYYAVAWRVVLLAACGGWVGSSCWFVGSLVAWLAWLKGLVGWLADWDDWLACWRACWFGGKVARWLGGWLSGLLAEFIAG